MSTSPLLSLYAHSPVPESSPPGDSPLPYLICMSISLSNRLVCLRIAPFSYLVCMKIAPCLYLSWNLCLASPLLLFALDYLLPCFVTCLLSHLPWVKWLPYLSRSQSSPSDGRPVPNLNSADVCSRAVIASLKQNCSKLEMPLPISSYYSDMHLYNFLYCAWFLTHSISKSLHWSPLSYTMIESACTPSRNSFAWRLQALAHELADFNITAFQQLCF